jgi:hypothetical protein
MSWLDKTLGESLETMDEMNAAIQKITLHDNDDTPSAALILCEGVPETEEVLNAVEMTEDAWHEDEEAPAEIVRALAERAYSEDVGLPPELARKAFDLIGEHRVLVDTRNGPVWLPPSDAETYRNETHLTQILDEINGDQFADVLSE